MEDISVLDKLNDYQLNDIFVNTWSDSLASMAFQMILERYMQTLFVDAVDFESALLHSIEHYEEM